jgi:hypothetical protein
VEVQDQDEDNRLCHAEGRKEKHGRKLRRRFLDEPHESGNVEGRRNRGECLSCVTLCSAACTSVLNTII